MRCGIGRSIAWLALVVLLPLAGADAAWSQTRTQVSAKAKTGAKAKPSKGKLDAKAKKTKKGRAAPQTIATDARIWTSSREGGSPMLQYGKGMDEAIVSFACQPEAGLVRVVALAGSGARVPKPGDGARIRFTSGRNRFELAGTAFAGGPGSVIYVSGTTRIVPRFFALFRGSETMNVEVGGRTTGVSLKGLGPRAEAFERACLARPR
jgi:hypothetical protein